MMKPDIVFKIHVPIWGAATRFKYSDNIFGQMAFGLNKARLRKLRGQDKATVEVRDQYHGHIYHCEYGAMLAWWVDNGKPSYMARGNNDIAIFPVSMFDQVGTFETAKYKAERRAAAENIQRITEKLQALNEPEPQLTINF